MMRRLQFPIILQLTFVALLLAAAPAPPAGLEDGVTTLAANAEAQWVPFDLTPGNQIRFAMHLDSRPITAVLDTGVSFSVLARASAVVDPARLTSGGQATAIGGAVATGWLPTGTISIGGLTRRGGGVSVADLPALATGGSTPVDMLVGRDITGGQALDIDYEHRRFRLIPTGRLPFTGATAPLAISAARRVYESALTVAGRRLAPMVVDTGDGSAITLSAVAWQRAGFASLPNTTTISFGLAGPAVSTLAIAPAVALGTQMARQVEVRVEPAGGFSQTIGVAGRIGSGFLQRYRVLLDPAAGRMVLQPGPTADQPPLRSTSGLLVGIEPDRLRVLHVMRGGPAEAAGWRDGDRICRINGAPIPADYAGDPIATWSIGAPGTVVTLGLCTGEVRSLTLKSFY
jgi:hypothetical protein